MIFTFVIRALKELVFFFLEDRILSVRIYEVYNFEMCLISIYRGALCGAKVRNSFVSVS